MQLNAKVIGSGPAIILLHGLFGSLENLGRVGTLLSKHYTVHALDQRNHGRSPHDSEMNYQVMAHDVLAYMDHAKLSDTFVLGHSMGGKVAMTMALNAPERLRGVIVADIAPVQYAPHHDEIFKALSTLNLASMQDRQEANHYLQSFGIHPEIVPFLLKNLIFDRKSGFKWRINLPVLDKEYPKLLEGMPHDRQYGGPVLFIVGGMSDYVRLEHEPIIRQMFPEFEVKIINGASHWLHAEKPDLFSAISLRFLEKIKAKPFIG